MLNGTPSCGGLPRGPPPQVAKNGPLSQGPIQRIYQRRGRVDFPIFGLVGVDFLHFGFVRLHFLSFWPSGPLFYLLGLHFGLWGVHFGILSPEGGYPFALCALLGLPGVYPFALCGLLSLQGGILHNFGPPTVGPPPPQVAKNGPFPQGPIQRIYQRRGRVDFPIFGLVGVDFLYFWFVVLNFLSFWPSGPSF